MEIQNAGMNLTAVGSFVFFFVVLVLANMIVGYMAVEMDPSDDLQIQKKARITFLITNALVALSFSSLCFILLILFSAFARLSQMSFDA